MSDRGGVKEAGLVSVPASKDVLQQVLTSYRLPKIFPQTLETLNGCMSTQLECKDDEHPRKPQCLCGYISSFVPQLTPNHDLKLLLFRHPSGLETTFHAQ